MRAMRLGDARASRVLGSACASHAGDGALAIANFSSYLLAKTKFVSARRRNQRARRTRSPELPRRSWFSLCVTACRRGMVDQQHLKPLAEETFLQERCGLARPAGAHGGAGTTPRGRAILHRQNRQPARRDLPHASHAELLSRGQQRFDIYCAVCHSRTGDGNGMIVQRGFPQPPSLHEQRLRDAPPGHFFDVITNGYGVMYPYASRVSPEDRWAIAAYIRALQLSQHAAPSDAEPAGLKQLQAAQP